MQKRNNSNYKSKKWANKENILIYKQCELHGVKSIQILNTIQPY